MPESLDTQLLEETVLAAINGDARARSTLLESYWHVIEGAVRARLHLVHGREETADLSQDAAIRALAGLRGYAWQGKKPFLVWLARIADTAVLDSARKQIAGRRDARREVSAFDDERTPAMRRSAESMADVSTKADAVQVLMQKLDVDERVGIEMSVLGYSYEEIAQHLGSGSEAVRKRIERAQHSIAKALRKGL